MINSENTSGSEHKADSDSGASREVSMAETDTEIIDKQIVEGLSLEEKGGEPFLNNFYLNLTGGLMRNMVEQYGLLDEIMVAANEATVLSGDDDSSYRYSDRALATTWRTFFQEIDEVLEQAGLSSDEVTRLRTIQQQTFADAGLTKYLLPVYRELRIRGYAHGELMR